MTNLDELNYGVHAFLSEQQGVVELNNGKTACGRVYAYSIIKTTVKPSGVQYTLTLQIAFEEAVLNIQSSHSEIGTTGQREAVILEAAIRQGAVTSDMKGWAYDPYISDYNNGVLFNLSEQAELDKYFPGHALSEARLLKELYNEDN